MTWLWLGEIVRGFFSALFGQAQKNAEAPKVTTDAKTPEKTRLAWDAYIAAKLRDKKRGGDQHGE